MLVGICNIKTCASFFCTFGEKFSGFKILRLTVYRKSASVPPIAGSNHLNPNLSTIYAHRSRIKVTDLHDKFCYNCVSDAHNPPTPPPPPPKKKKKKDTHTHRCGKEILLCSFMQNKSDIKLIYVLNSSAYMSNISSNSFTNIGSKHFYL